MASSPGWSTLLQELQATAGLRITKARLGRVAPTLAARRPRPLEVLLPSASPSPPPPSLPLLLSPVCPVSAPVEVDHHSASTTDVLRFALATYFMKRGGSRSCQAVDDFFFTSPSFDLTFDSEKDDVEEDQLTSETPSDESFSSVVWTHVLSLSQLLQEQRFQECVQQVAELREYTLNEGLLPSLVTVLVKMLKEEDQDAEKIPQVIQSLCFENGEPSAAFDQLVELLFEALANCSENKEIKVENWLLRALNSTMNALHHHEQHFRIESMTAKLQALTQATAQHSDEHTF